MNELFAGVEVLTFDCYGTLIDWERGLLGMLRPVLERRGVRAEDEALLEAYGREEVAQEAGEYRPYRQVVAGALRGICRGYGFQPAEWEAYAFAGSVGDWPPFPDSGPALQRLAQRFRLGVITNCDDDLFARSNAQLGVRFDRVITAQQVRSYKPSLRHFEAALEAMDLPRERIVHVAQSLYHDHVPAKQLGLRTVWVNRRQGKSGGGATPPAEAAPDLVVPDMRTLAEAAVGKEE